jgi:transcriptional regulator with XRE-family HTH domain
MSTPLESILLDARRRRSLPEPPLRRLLRERADLSQLEIAEALGVSRPAVTRWESGQREPRSAMRVKYAQLLERLAQEVEQ